MEKIATDTTAACDWAWRLATLVTTRPGLVVGLWGAVFLLALPLALRAPTRLSSGSGDIPHSPSYAADSLLAKDFDNPYSQLLVLTLKSSRPQSDSDSTETEILREVEQSLSGLPQVTEVMTSEHMLDKRLLPIPGTGSIALIGVKTEFIQKADHAVSAIRQRVNPILEHYRKKDPGLRWAVTGRAALSYDFNRFNAREARTAEVRMIPLTLLILLATFGSLTAAGLPLLLGILATIICMGVVFLIARHGEVSNLVENTSSMIGLAVGIDYSLLLVHRYRESLAGMVLRAGGVAHPLLRKRALIACMGIAGKTVLYSGITVVIGLAGLLFTPEMETRSIGLGGVLAVMIALMAALTLLPALMVWLGPKLDERALAFRVRRTEPRNRIWAWWSAGLMRRAPWAVIAGLSAIAALSWPAHAARFGFPEGNFIPQEMEFTRGFTMLRTMGLQGVLSPLDVMLTTRDGGPVLKPERIPDLYALSAHIKRVPIVSHLFGPVDLSDSQPLVKYQNLYADPDGALEDMPFVRQFFLSQDERSLLLQVVLKDGTPLAASERLAREIPTWVNQRLFQIREGGQAVQSEDFDRATESAYAPTVLFVLAATLGILLLLFRAPLVSLKALFMNALSVGAGYGMVVYVFQLGHGHSLFGMPGPAGVVPLSIPLLLFCILFGLSMDYEVFLLNRIREGYLKNRDNTRSVAEGLTATGPVITSAALIMASVFGAFAFSRTIEIQMLGLGLAVAVLVDAFILRILLAPAIMKLAGKWNWWPAT